MQSVVMLVEKLDAWTALVHWKGDVALSVPKLLAPEILLVHIYDL